MAEIVNLKRVRKDKARAERESVAAAHRATFGRTRVEKARAEAEARLTEERLAGHRRERDPD